MQHAPSIRILLALATALAVSPALAAADYGVDALRGSDSNPGTLAQPFKTLTKAFGVAKGGDRVFVFPGRYGPTHGETFPLTVADGVKVLGANARTCVIDAEFDPNVTNPKDPKVNPVQGTVIIIGANCELAFMGIVNGPRDPGNPGNYWWNIALHIKPSANADNAHVHHCVLDEFSRGIFVGGPSGSHSFKNVTIDNCVFSRFYVEAINATVNSGSASGNRIFNCTIVGHKNPSTKKNYGRACMSFGTGAQFDIRNCVIKDADWAGIEAVAQSSITSDFNCLHGSTAAFRGVTKGKKDIEKDPGLAALPTTKQTLDPHQSGPLGPLWEAGTNIVTTGNDIDHGSPRLLGAYVDIGADEFTGTDTWFVGPAAIGSTMHIGALGSAGNTVLFALSLGSIAPVTIPGIQGRFELDLQQPNVILSFATSTTGFVRQAAPIPKDTRLIGITAFIQCVDVKSATLSDLDFVKFVN